MQNEINKCICEEYGMEQGDTLYISADWDNGIGFDYIRNIQYCPVCGKKLKEYHTGLENRWLRV